MAKPRGPNAELIRELAVEDLDLLKMLATNGRYKPKTERLSTPAK